MLKATPFFISALEAENQAQFEEIVQENVESWMLQLRAELDLATGYMPGNKFSQKSTRGAFVKALKKAIGKYRTADAQGLVTGNWLLPCGLTAASAYAFVRDQYDVNGIALDAQPCTPVPKWDGRVVQKLHIQRVRQPKIVCKKPKKRRKTKAEKPVVARSVAVVPRKPKISASEKEKMRLQQQENAAANALKKASRNLRQTPTGRRLAAQHSHALTSEQIARREALKAEALVAAENRGRAVTIGVLSVDAVGQPMQKAVVRRARKRDAEGNFVSDKYGRPVWEPQLLLVELSPEEAFRQEYEAWWLQALSARDFVETSEVDAAAVAALLEPKSPVPEPWVTEKPETKSSSSKVANKLAAKLTQGESNGRNKRRLSNQEEITASAEHAMGYQDTEARRQARGQEWYRENAALLEHSALLYNQLPQPQPEGDFS